MNENTETPNEGSVRLKPVISSLAAIIHAMDTLSADAMREAIVAVEQNPSREAIPEDIRELSEELIMKARMLLGLREGNWPVPDPKALKRIQEERASMMAQQIAEQISEMMGGQVGVTLLEEAEVAGPPPTESVDMERRRKVVRLLEGVSGRWPVWIAQLRATAEKENILPFSDLQEKWLFSLALVIVIESLHNGARWVEEGTHSLEFLKSLSYPDDVMPLGVD